MKSSMTSVKKLAWKIFVNLRISMLNSSKKLIKKGNSTKRYWQSVYIYIKVTHLI